MSARPTHEIWHKAQSASKVCLWISWATVTWALLSYAAFHLDLDLPYAIQLLTMLSAAIALVGGTLAVLFVTVGARTIRLVASGLLAAAANFVYAWSFVHGP